MKSTTIRELKHATSKVLGWAEAGECIEVRRRGKPVAILTPLRRRPRLKKPDFAVRLREIYGPVILSATGTGIVQESRGER